MYDQLYEISTRDYPGLSFQRAQCVFLNNDGQGLFDQGCVQNDGSKNCTAACQDPEKIFGSMYTFQNCLAYPKISDLLALGNMSGNDQEFAKNYGVERANITNAINSTINKCISSYCTKTGSCDNSRPTSIQCYDYSYYMADIPRERRFYYSYYKRDDTIMFADICANQTSNPVDPDLGGIGIYISYWMQSVIALLGFILLKFWSSWTYYSCLGIFLWPCGLSGAKQRAQFFQSKGRAHLPALISALVEFQKAQCFFILAVEIAAQIVISNGLFQANNLQQLFNNYALVSSIAISGLLPIAFILLCLHTSDMKSWYIFVLSTCAIAVSTVTLYNTKYPDTTPILEPTITSYTDCQMRDPSTFCLDEGEFDNSSAIGLGGHLLPVVLVTWLFIFFDQYNLIHRPWFRHLISWSLRSPYLVWRYALQTVPKLQRTLELRWKWKAKFDERGFLLQLWLYKRCRSIRNWNIWLIVKDATTRLATIIRIKTTGFLKQSGLHTSQDWLNLFVTLVFGVVWFLYLYYFWSYLKLLQFFKSVGALNVSMGLGQIVALTVWIPSLVEYANLQIRGVQRGSEYRIALPYRVTVDMVHDSDAKNPSSNVDVTSDSSHDSLLHYD